MIKFKLYVIGESQKSNTYVDELKTHLDSKFNGNYQLETVDLLKNFQKANEDHVLCTPTLIKVEPAPVRKVIGDLSDMEKVLNRLMSA